MKYFEHEYHMVKKEEQAVRLWQLCLFGMDALLVTNLAWVLHFLF